MTKGAYHCCYLLGWLLAVVALGGHSEPLREDGLETIVVVARGWDVISGTVAIDGEETGAGGLRRNIDLAERVPALQVEVTTSRLTRYAIRGLGSSSFNDGMDSSVAMVVDGVYLGRQGMFLDDLGDLERIEILRGPQGTLAGKNSSAGVINVTTRQPTSVPEAGIDWTYGSDQLRELSGFLSGPLSGTELVGRLAFSDRRRDGLIRNRFDGRDYNEVRRQSLRGQLVWAPNPRISARLIADAGWQNEDCCAFTVSQYSAVSRASADFIGYPLPLARPLRREVEHDTDSRSEVRQRAVTLQVDWVPGRGDHHLVSISGWRDWDMTTRLDLDGIGLAVAPNGGHQLMHRQFSQELRLSGLLGSQLEYVAGAYHLEQRLARNGWIQYGRHAADWFAGAVPLLRELGIVADQIDDELLSNRLVSTPGRQESRSQALYGQLIWSPAPRLQVRPGLRYTWERKSGSASRVVGGHSFQPDDPINQLVSDVLAGALGQPYHHRERMRENHLSGQLAISYQFTPQRLGYVRWSRGVKSGGVNAEPVSRGVNPTFDAERVSMLELGLDQRFWNDLGRFQLALFDIDVKDYQALTYASESLGSNPQRDNLMNVGSVSSRGIDLETTLQLDDWVSVRLAAAWNDAHYRDFDNAPCPPGSTVTLCDLGGKRLFGSPAWSVTSGIDTSYSLGDSHLLYATVEYHWRSGFYGTLERGVGSYQSARGIVNTRLGLNAANGDWELALWARNLLDERYIAAVYALTGTGDYGAVVGDPRTIGVTLRLRY